MARLSNTDVLTWVSLTEVAESWWKHKVSCFKNTFGRAQTPVGAVPLLLAGQPFGSGN